MGQSLRCVFSVPIHPRICADAGTPYPDGIAQPWSYALPTDFRLVLFEVAGVVEPGSGGADPQTPR